MTDACLAAFHSIAVSELNHDFRALICQVIAEVVAGGDVAVKALTERFDTTHAPAPSLLEQPTTESSSAHPKITAQRRRVP